MYSPELIDIAAIPGGGELRLMRYGPEFSIEFEQDELMGSQAPQSEQALADLASARTLGRQDRVLIGGLGMGFTLGAALSAFPAHTKIVVAELVPQVVVWANGPLAHLFSDYLSDPRVTIAVRDVHDVIAATPGGFDAILLDVDNGPDGLTRAGNNRLYSARGLDAARAALKPGGVLAVWSAASDANFARRLRDADFSVEEVAVRARSNGKGPRHVIWFATKR